MNMEDGSGAGNEGKDVVKTPLDELRGREQKLWDRLESLLVRHSMKVAQRPAVEAAIKLIEAVEEFREAAREIAEGIRELTMIIRQEILLEEPNIATNALAARVDEALKNRIEFHFRPITPELPEVQK